MRVEIPEVYFQYVRTLNSTATSSHVYIIPRAVSPSWACLAVQSLFLCACGDAPRAKAEIDGCYQRLPVEYFCAFCGKRVTFDVKLNTFSVEVGTFSQRCAPCVRRDQGPVGQSGGFQPSLQPEALTKSDIRTHRKHTNFAVLNEMEPKDTGKSKVLGLLITWKNPNLSIYVRGC
ncbi:hypothetical protein NDU88_011164 [Pleurodeles waltl]|uniref:Uncharacterized protein n=1 Tax=Pleurodeles waltl TaxID=8319 RepID=A0AAV7QY11_PLEWA|nr:hypothetical protein NDU88_011164 [Pleurodeles waltl]